MRIPDRSGAATVGIRPDSRSPHARERHSPDHVPRPELESETVGAGLPARSQVLAEEQPMARHSSAGLAVMSRAWLPEPLVGEAKATVSAVRGTIEEPGQQEIPGGNPDAHSGHTGRIDPRHRLGKGRSGGNLGN